MNKKTDNNENTLETQNVQRKSEKDRNSVIGGFVFGSLFTFVAWRFYELFFKFPIGKIVVILVGMVAALCYAVTVSCFFDYKESKKIEKLEEEARLEEKEFAEIDLEKRALRAEKLFRMNQKELMRYYDLNLSQTRFLSELGICMIIIGMAIIIVSLYWYISMDADKVIIYVGGVSGIVTDFIGAIFIKMYTENIEAAVKFHAKLADSNHLLLANSIANKIEDKVTREDTLSEISKNMVLRSITMG